MDRPGKGWMARGFYAAKFPHEQALTGRTLYRVKIADLEAAARGVDIDLPIRVERVGQVPPSDGLAFHEGKIYVTAIEDGAIVRYDPVARTTDVVAEDKRLLWPDSFAFGPDGSLYVTTSQIHLRRDSIRERCR